jgi:glucan-binding YG repeat protein
MNCIEQEYFTALKKLLHANKGWLLSKGHWYYLGDDYLLSYLFECNRLRLLLNMSLITMENLPTDPNYSRWYIPFKQKSGES